MPVAFKDGSSQLITRPSFAERHNFQDQQMNLVGGSFLRSDAYMAREAHFFISDPEDIVDVQIAEYFKAHPHAYANTRLTRIRPGIYSMYEGAGREIGVEWNGQLIVRDGPLKQAFAEYLANKSPNASNYGGSVFRENIAEPAQVLPQLPGNFVAKYDEIMDRRRADRTMARSMALPQPGHGGFAGGYRAN